MKHELANKALHLTAIPLHLIAAGELNRYKAKSGGRHIK